MKSFLNLRTQLFFLLLYGTVTVAAPSQDFHLQIQAEITRLQQTLKDQPVADPDFASILTATSDALKAASDELNSGRVYACLEKLALAKDYLQGARAGADKEDVLKSGLPAYEAKWGKANVLLAEFEEEAAKRDWSRAPAAVRALSETAQARAVPLLEGGRGFATATAPKDGLFYLGQAQGEAEFARFCASLKFGETRKPLPLRSMLPELVALQQKTNAAFQPPRSIELHSRFIALNSTIKLALELDERKFYAGALYQYLEAVRHYAMLDAPAVDASRHAALIAGITAERNKLAVLPRDVSIAQLFLERAASQVTHPDGSAPLPDEWRSTQVVLDHVLPAYFAAEKAPRSVPSRTGKTVTLTLVRWPYT